MKISILALVFTLTVAFAANWAPQDYEIFSLNDKIRQDLGEGTTFYLWLGLKSPKASVQEITKAYRKKLRLLHPDKFSGSSKSERKRAEERFQRLSLVGNILRDQSLRKRYDYFLAKGFPKWKGTGYYYSKFRPGLVLTFVLLFVLVGTLHFVALRINRGQDHKRIAALKNEIKTQAWGGSQLPPADGSDRKVGVEGGKQFLVGATGEVSLIDTDEEGNASLVPLDEDDINLSPGFRELLFFRFPAWLWNVSGGRLTGKLVDTNVVYVNPKRPVVEQEKAKTKKKASRGEKVELANGKVIYARKGRKQK